MSVDVLSHAPKLGVAPNSSSAMKEDMSVDAVFLRYRSRERVAVRQFLLAHFDVLDMVLEAPPYLEAIFGVDVSLELEVIANPETSDPPELWVNVVTPCESDEEFHEARRKMTLFSTSDWWRAHYPQVRGRSGFALTFAPDEEAV